MRGRMVVGWWDEVFVFVFVCVSDTTRHSYYFIEW